VTPAPLSTVRIVSVIIRECTSSVVLLSHFDDPNEAATDELRSWLWDTSRMDVVNRGRALGRCFEFKVDNAITIKIGKVFAKMAQSSPGMILVLTAKTPAAFLPLLGYKVGRELYRIELVRVGADKRQTVIAPLRIGEEKRVQVEVQPRIPTLAPLACEPHHTT